MDKLTGEWKNLYDLVQKQYSIRANVLNPEGTTTALHIIVARGVPKPGEALSGLPNQWLDEILQGYGYNFDVQDENGATPLFLAAFKGNLYAVKRLLSKNVSITKKDINGFSPFYIACLMATREDSETRMEILDAFLEKINGSFNDELTDELNSKWARLPYVVKERLRKAGFRSQANTDREEREREAKAAREQAAREAREKEEREARERLKASVDAELATILPKINDLTHYLSIHQREIIIQQLTDELMKKSEKTARDTILQNQIETLTLFLRREREKSKLADFEKIWTDIARNILHIEVNRNPRMAHVLPNLRRRHQPWQQPRQQEGIIPPPNEIHRKIFEDLRKLLNENIDLPESEYQKILAQFKEDAVRLEREEEARKKEAFYQQVRGIRTDLSEDEVRALIANYYIHDINRMSEDAFLYQQRQIKLREEREKEERRLAAAAAAEKRRREEEERKKRISELEKTLNEKSAAQTALMDTIPELNKQFKDDSISNEDLDKAFQALQGRLDDILRNTSESIRLITEIIKLKTAGGEDISKEETSLNSIRETYSTTERAKTKVIERYEKKKQLRRRNEMRKLLLEKMDEWEENGKRLPGSLERFQDDKVSDEEFRAAYRSSKDLIARIDRILLEIKSLISELIRLQKTFGEDEEEITRDEQLLDSMREEYKIIEGINKQVTADFYRRKEERIEKQKREKEEKNRSLSPEDFFALLADTETGEERARELLRIWRDRVNELVDRDGDTALMIMIRRGFLTAAADLLEGANVEQRNSLGETAATLAVDGIGLADTEGEALQYIELMVNARMNLNTQDRNGNTALLLSIQNEYGRAVMRLKELDVDISLTNKEGDNAAKLALKKLRLLTTSPKENAFIQLLIKNLFTRENIDTQDDEGNTILISMAAFGIPEEIERLLALGPNLNIQNGDGRTALMMAAIGLSTSVNNPDDFNRYIQTMRVLLTSEKIDVNLDDKKGLDVGDTINWLVHNISISDDPRALEKLRELREIQSLIDAKRDSAPRRLLGRMLGWRGGERKTLKRSKRASNKKGKTMRKK
jgi:ankyrin repeat protein